MSDVNSTTPLGTESASVVAGLSTNGSDSALTVLSFAANVGDGFFVAVPAGMVGYWKASYMVDWRPIPTAGLNATLSCATVQGSSFTLQVKRVPSGADVTGIQAGRLNLLQPVTE